MELGLVEVQALPRDYVPTQPSIGVDGTFADRIRLIGCDAGWATTELDITLHWQAVRRMEYDYKIFVHLSSFADERIAAQHDSMPRQWAYPSSWWDAGEIVTDAVTLDLRKSSPGRHEVSVGIYDPDTMERLQAIDRSGALLPERKLLLPFILDTTG